MDIEMLIVRLKWWAEECDRTNYGCQARPTLQNAATFLSTLQSEAEGMRSNWYKSVEEIQKLRAELEQVKHQRDSYRLYHDDLASKPNCNTCADKDCKYRPIPGDTVRANCPLWRGPEEG